MKCVFCGGKTEQRLVTFIYDASSEYLFVENVPAEVCSQCGERTYAPEVTDDLLRIAKKKLAPIKTVAVPVFEYAHQSSVF